VRKIHEYLAHAAECRALARNASPAHRQQLEQMAATWEQLADARRRQLQKQGNTDDEDANVD
jgi:ferric-dicitrate binding protein FerR (iron transport regulator)